MTGIFVYLSFFTLAVSILADSTVPLFLWSGKDYFGDENHHHSEAKGLFRVDDFVSNFMVSFGGNIDESKETMKKTHDLLTNYIAKEGLIMPEVVVAFVYSELDSADAARRTGSYSNDKNTLSMSFLKDALAKSKSSLIVPHVLRKTSSVTVSDQLTNAFSKINPKPEIVELELNGEQNGMGPEVDQNVAGCKALMSHINSNEWMFSNLVTDLIIIKAEDFQDVQEECVHSLLERVNTLTSGHYVAMLTADRAKTNIARFFPVPKDNLNSLSVNSASSQPPLILASEGSQMYVLASSKKSDDWKGVRYLSPNILFGLFIGLIFLVTVLCGVSCLLAIQTPQRLGSVKYNIGKQS